MSDVHTLQQLDTQIMWVINQEPVPWDGIESVRKALLGSLRGQVHFLDSLPVSADEDVIVVPDTNALLFNPALEEWSWSDVARFRVALTPTVLSELDRLKAEHRSEGVKGKANRLIRQFKEYRRRGRLTEGVPLRNGVSTIYALAIDPDMSSSLSWLDAANQDDRLLATVMEIGRRHVRRPVALVTLDINLQNKAEFADVPFIEPPAPSGEV